MLLAEASGTFSCRPGVGEFCLVCKSPDTRAVARLGPGEVVGETGGVALLASQTCTEALLVPGCPVSADLSLGTEDGWCVKASSGVRLAAAMACSYLPGSVGWEWGCTSHPAMPITLFGKGNSREQFLLLSPYLFLRV